MAYKEDYQKVRVVNSTPLPVDVIQDSSETTAFGEVQVGMLTPFVQATACYNLIPANMRTYTATGGSAGASGGEFICQTGTQSGGYGVVRSLRTINYKGGIGGLCRFTARFTAGVANSQQGAGLFNLGDGLLFGYNGATFGIIYQHHGKAETRNIQVTVASSGSTNLTLTLNSVAYTIPLTAGTVQHNAYEIATWLNANQTVWEAYQNDDDVIVFAISDGAKAGTYSYSHATSTGTITQITAGVTKTTDFIAQTAWNQDTASWLNPTKGNVYQVQYQYLGYGAIDFFIEVPEEGRFKLVHRIKYANTATTPTLSNPSMHAGIYAASLGSTTNLTAAMASVGAFLQGTPGRTRNTRSATNVKSVGTSFTNLFSIRNRKVFNTEINQVEIEPEIISAFTESAKGATIRLVVGATLGGEPNWQYVEQTNVVSEIDTAGTTVTGGTTVAEFVVPQNSAISINLDPVRLRIPPSFVLTVAAKVNSGAASDTGAALVVYEDL